MGKFIDITGQKFGRLTVLYRLSPKGEKHIKWVCRCECGSECIVIGDNLKRGNTYSCGCFQKEKAAKSQLKHGHHKRGERDRLYNIWCGMKTRCNNSKLHIYKYYGGRGITVCEEWQHSFQAFHDWAVANGYADSLTIDRIDVNGNYEPSNCRWATMKTQNNNKRNNKIKPDEEENTNDKVLHG